MLIESVKPGQTRLVFVMCPVTLIPVQNIFRIRCHKWNEGHQAQVLRKFCQEIGIKQVTHHQLRATHIILALIDGVPLGIVKENVGHAKLSTTYEYFRSAGINMRVQTDGLRIDLAGQN